MIDGPTVQQASLLPSLMAELCSLLDVSERRHSGLSGSVRRLQLLGLVHYTGLHTLFCIRLSFLVYFPPYHSKNHVSIWDLGLEWQQCNKVLLGSNTSHPKTSQPAVYPHESFSCHAPSTSNLWHSSCSHQMSSDFLCCPVHRLYIKYGYSHMTLSLIIMTLKPALSSILLQLEP